MLGTGVEFNFRAFRDTDYSELKSVIDSLYIEDPVDELITDEKISNTIRELHDNPCKGQIIIFGRAGVTIGYAILIFYWSNEFGGDVLLIDELYVKPEHRRQGTATSFFRYVCQTFVDKTHLIRLDVTPSNTKAMNCYRKLGFKQMRNVRLARTM